MIYFTAKQSGNDNVYFINGQDILNSVDAEIMTVDGSHPTDFGFWCVEEAIGKVLAPILKK